MTTKEQELREVARELVNLVSRFMKGRAITGGEIRLTVSMGRQTLVSYQNKLRDPEPSAPLRKRSHHLRVVK